MTPWRVNFPVITDPATRKECLALMAIHIPDARGPAFPSTMCNVLGFTRDGQHLKFTIPIETYMRAQLAPVHLLEVDNIQGPKGSIVDPTGRAISDPIGGSIPHRHDHATKL